MFKKVCLLFLLLFSDYYLVADNLLKNSNFAQKSIVGLPLQWEVRGKNADGCLTADNIVKIGSDTVLVQHDLRLTGGNKYALSFKVRSARNSRYRLYCAWTVSRDGKKVWPGSDTAYYTADKEWKERKVIFTYDTDATPAYVAIEIPGDGEAEFKDLALEPDKKNSPDNPNLLVNSDFAVRDVNNSPAGWEARGDKKSFFYGCGSVMLKGSDGKDLYFIQRNHPLQAGTNYEVSYEVKGGVKDKEYRVYYEVIQAIDGKDVWKSFATEFCKTADQWETKIFTFILPEKVRSSHLVFNVKSGVDVEFRNITLKAVDEKKGKKQLGGVWQLYSGSNFSSNTDGREMLYVKSNSAGAGAVLKGAPLEAGKKYTVSYSVRGEGECENNTGFHPFQLRVEFDGIAEKAASAWDDTWNNSFQNKQFSFVVPANAASGKVNIECVVRSKGCVIFDNIALAETKDNPAEKYVITLDSPCYRDMIFSSMPVGEITGSVVTDPSISSVNLILKNGDNVIYSGKVDNAGGKVSFTIPAADLPVGKYVLSAELSNKTDIVATTQLVIKKLPPAAVEVVQGKDRNFYINGKVFFPVTVWSPVRYSCDEETLEAALYYAARQGVNLIQRFAPDEKSILQILNAAEKYGIKVSLEVLPAQSCETRMLKLWTHHISNVLTPAVTQHPALLDYFLADEPSWTGVPAKNLTSSYQVLKELDPYHPVWINAAPRGSIDEHKLYSQAADIYGVDIYPVPKGSHSGLEDKYLTSVGKYAQRMSEAVGGRKPIWMALQGFSWTYVDDRNADKRLEEIGYPTYIQSRFMTYDALVNNASSAGYWGTVFIYAPGFYDMLFSITRELHEMSGLLTQGKIVDDVTSENQSIKCRTIDFDGKKYLIALNNSDKAVTPEISGKFTVPELQVFQENRNVAVSGGKFSDSFKPFEVHVYGEAALPPPVNMLIPANPELDKKGNPFHKIIKLRIQAVMYDGKANWIWEKDNMAVAGSRVWLGKEFVIDKPVKSARLLLSADDKCTAYFNGQELGRITGWSLMKEFDLARLMRQGGNLLSIAAEDAGGLPCGVLADLKIETADGKIMSILSDSTWLASAKEMPDWLTPSTVRKWSPAAIAAPYGAGAWGRQVQLPQE
ncbi:MAG: carbohydrate binding domain-containing protein [Lentisphaerota bacterium]